MSLKAFHIFFILASALMCLGIGAWRAAAFAEAGGAGAAVQAASAFLATIALLVYGVRFLRKFKELSYL